MKLLLLKKKLIVIWKKHGPTKNFKKVVSLYKGNIIILNNQGDVWLTYQQRSP